MKLFNEIFVFSVLGCSFITFIKVTMFTILSISFIKVDVCYDFFVYNFLSDFPCNLIK